MTAQSVGRVVGEGRVASWGLRDTGASERIREGVSDNCKVEKLNPRPQVSASF